MAHAYTPFLSRDRTSGRMHRRVEETDLRTGAKRVMVDERCQTDQSGAYERLDMTDPDDLNRLSEAETVSLCGHCYPGPTPVVDSD